jgi:uroporphyrinogen decarboxylase
VAASANLGCSTTAASAEDAAGQQANETAMPAALGHRDRVLRSIEHRDVDRVACYFAAEAEGQAMLRARLGLRDAEEATRFFDADTIQVTVYCALPDLSGVERVEDLDGLAWPGREQVDLAGAVARAREARATGLAVLGGSWATIFTGARRSMGEERYLLAMVDQPDLIAEIVRRAADGFVDINEALFSECADCLDVFYYGTDFGTQQSLFISPDAFRRFFLPHLARLAEHARGFGLKVMFHTCGAVADLIPDFIACGIDVLDPVQVAATAMAPGMLAARFGGRIAFHGGISTQTLLPRAAPAEVRAGTEETIGAFGPTGYIAGPDQWLMSDIPVANVVAMYEAIRGYRAA